MRTSSDDRLTPDGESAWLRFKQHLHWCDHFALGFIFTDHPGVITIFRKRLARIYRARVTGLHIPVPSTPEHLLTELLPDLLHPSMRQRALQAPYWVDLSAMSGSIWNKHCLLFLSRLNEQRESLRQALGRPLILILPLSERVRIKQTVPDLWAIRDFSIVTDNWAVISAAPRQKDDIPAVFALTPYEQSLVDEWKRLQSKSRSPARDFLIVANRALAACLKAGKYSLAGKIAESMKYVADQRIAINGETPESLRDLSVSLEKVGDTAKAMGEWEKAQTSFEESLRIRRNIIERVGETPESLRDLSVSLNKVGDTAQAMGEWEKAQTSFEESLRIRRNIIERVGETPESLRDLSVSLNKVGDTAQAMGEWKKAQTSFEESLRIHRNIIERVGETPESLRDLSVSLDNVGDTAQAMGEWEKAQTSFENALAIVIPLARAMPNHSDFINLPDYFRNRLRSLKDEK